MEDEELECFEYVREDGQVRHVLQCLCECTDLDSLADDYVKWCCSCCEKERPSSAPERRAKLRGFFRACADRARIPWPSGAKRLNAGALAAAAVLWALRRLLELSSCWQWVLFWLVLGGLHLAWVHLTCLQLNMRSDYLVSWLLVSIAGLYYDFLVHVWRRQSWFQILWCHALLAEVLASFLAALLLKPKQEDSESMCRVCGHIVPGRDHHCVWINQCVGSHNHRAFLCFLLGLTVLSWSYACMVLSADLEFWTEMRCPHLELLLETSFWRVPVLGCCKGKPRVNHHTANIS
ncbi:unnamed protein product [Effrenium voratum]|nr:unnamed protein product [Effrenium voratum]